MEVDWLKVLGMQIAINAHSVCMQAVQINLLNSNVHYFHNVNVP